MRLTLRTPASGVAEGEDFYFFIVQNRTDSSGMLTTTELRKDVDNYRSGDSFSFQIDNLVVGDTYTFGARAGNAFGRSTDVVFSSTSPLNGQFVLIITFVV